ncbi:dihydrolipoyl dehydrogenase [Alicyclobacillus mengziensis]|uniref:Dihydrolipoyl dehydrogenase n=1 Tax=Alicyclobacillus mengziensis TaxID=2931921 RepID=A0A9X7Z4A8_9BACL|nr:dihydrolipoyl dehydrogenase [Alicyclobacillus mengziensis]QSO45799.1 dihydrolipoyl dehydrogenase [Alicyclobacillus mengziensis]
MPESELDLVILGGGTGGYVAAIRAAQLGMKVAIVERDKLGGTCLHRGCIPSKALLRTAEVFSVAKEAESFGVELSQPKLNLTQAMSRKDKVVGQLYQGVQFLMKKHNIQVYSAVGRLMGPSIFSPQAGSVMVDYGNGETEILAPRYTLVATGSTPKSLPGLAFDGIKVLSSDDALNLTSLPEAMLIVGAGAIGVEWASMLSDMGVQVTLIEFLPRILPLEDEDISKEAARLLKKRGVKIVTEARVEPASLEISGDKVRIQAEVRGTDTMTMEANQMLVAVGRAPVVDDIGLEATEIQLNKQRAIVVDENYQTKEKNIFAIGDVIGGVQLAHAAAHEGIHAVEVMAGFHPRPIDYTMMAKCTYSRPEVASVGLTEAEAREQGYQVKTGKFQFRANGKALVFGDADGFVKVVSDANSDDLLGVHMIGPHVTDQITEAGLARVLNATPWEIAHTVHPHPTLSEALGEAALAVDGLAIHGS